MTLRLKADQLKLRKRIVSQLKELMKRVIERIPN